MTVHKLSAGDGYTYLTRQVASADERRPAGQPLADYYTAHGNPPGVWLGGGAASLGIEGSEVSEAQMRALFGEGAHPNRDAMLTSGATNADTRLGSAYPRFEPPSDEHIAGRAAQFEAGTGRPPSAAEYKRIALQEARRVRRAVAGFDLVFTPVKSASLLWALGGPDVRAAVEAAHHEAVASTIGWVEEHAAYTRTGHGGVAQVDTTGLVCAAFDHRESRSSDPDLHTHVAVANKVCGLDGKWRSLDARGLHALGVAASERYNTRFEDALARRVGVEFVERPGGGKGKRPIREVGGVPLELIRHFSKRRAAIEDAYTELARAYRADHGRDPSRTTQLRLAQQATLATRQGKSSGHTLAEQVTGWTEEAFGVVGCDGLRRMLATALGHTPPRTVLDPVEVEAVAVRVLASVSEQRSTWTRWNLYAEAERQLRSLRFATAQERDAVTDTVVGYATSPDLSIRISAPAFVVEPEALRRASDGQSVFVPHGAERYTCATVLNAEEYLVAAARSGGAMRVDPRVADAAIRGEERRHGVHLDDGQFRLVDTFATSKSPLVIGIGPAGAGKTTAMRTFAACWVAGAGRVVPLAASAKAAEVLGDQLGMRAENLHKFLHESRRDVPNDDWFRLAVGDVVLVDEAGMAGTLQLAELVKYSTSHGAAVRLLGDSSQLASVEAGGALRLLESEVGAVRLDHLHRFTDQAEAAATLRLRRGDPAALGFYESRHRIRAGSRDAMAQAAYDGWATDIRAGLSSVLIAVTSADVASLNTRARLERIATGGVEADGVELHDGTRAGVGDWVVTRTNLRGLTCRGGRDWVKNGDTWQVLKRHEDGALTVRHLDHKGKLRLPASYVEGQLELAYASTVHRSQGITVDTAHPLVTPEMTRESLYVASTRGRIHTTFYVATEELLEATGDHLPDPPRSARDVLVGVLGRLGGQASATEVIRSTCREACELPSLVARYDHTRHLAARDALERTATQALPSTLARRVLADPAASSLSTALADATGRGADPSLVLRGAVAFDDLAGVRSVASVLAARIEDYGPTFGVPRKEPADRPLPWLSSPHVGHPDWDAHLGALGDPIRQRANVLGSLRHAYREQYQLGHLIASDLGVPPPVGTRARTAYNVANAEPLPEPPSFADIAARLTPATPRIASPPPDWSPADRQTTPSRGAMNR